MFHYSIVLFYNECNPSSFSLIAQINSHLPKKSGTITMFSGWKWQSLQETHPTGLTVFPLGHNQHSRLTRLIVQKFYIPHDDRWNRRFILAPLSFPLSSSTKTSSSSPYLIQNYRFHCRKKYSYWRYWADVTSFYSAWHQGRENTILLISKKIMICLSKQWLLDRTGHFPQYLLPSKTGSLKKKKTFQVFSVGSKYPFKL